ncbi:secretory calcium-binding phosphoprotein 1 isoform X1 [Nothobranchius furzeri]|uniref:Starmaker n=1 Tax=Nothobranchius furzeri TaxID=105023 RepID=A0A1A7ZK08_NOTFU|nr:secretory calcium-binding phosphoprotein 1 isoform X1 [Nothobranchius furzeri]
MKAAFITFCLFGAAFANPILHNALVSSELDSNSTESLSASKSAENNTSEIQSSEENVSNQSSESESTESTSEDKTSEESNSQSDEDNGMDSMPETKDDSMGSEENIRKQSWVRVFPGLVKTLSAEDNSSSTEVKGQPEYLNTKLADKQPTRTSTKKAPSHTKQPLLDTTTTDSSDTTSDSTDTSDITAATSNSSESISHESPESEENSSESVSRSTEDSNASDSSELQQIKTSDCVNGTQSCESEEHLFQSIGDDAHFSVNHLMVPDDEGELRLRRR